MRGFTLIEALVYLALFAILMGGGVVAAFNLFEAATIDGTRTMLTEETDFLVAKIDSTMSGTSSITAPAAGAVGGALTVVKYDASLGNPIVIARSGGNMTIARGGGTPLILNNTNVSVSALSFSHIQGSGDGINPEAVEADISVSAKTATGRTLTRMATTTVYLRH